jgi:hypothetical protein
VMFLTLEQVKKAMNWRYWKIHKKTI